MLESIPFYHERREAAKEAARIFAGILDSRVDESQYGAKGFATLFEYRRRRRSEDEESFKPKLLEPLWAFFDAQPELARAKMEGDAMRLEFEAGGIRTSLFARLSESGGPECGRELRRLGTEATDPVFWPPDGCRLTLPGGNSAHERLERAAAAALSPPHPKLMRILEGRFREGGASTIRIERHGPMGVAHSFGRGERFERGELVDWLALSVDESAETGKTEEEGQR